MRKLFLVFVTVMIQTCFANAQCCAGGSGCTIAGGTSAGVLQEKQIELSTNLQFINADKFYKKDALDTNRTFDSFESQYEYFRLAYGVSKNLTMSVESGYFFKKKEIGLHGDPVSTYKSKGIGDLIIFPRYDVYNHTGLKTNTEVMLGLGYKIPLGSHNDSTGNVEPFSGTTYYVTKPLSVQLSSGAQDIIFYTFLFHGFTKQNFRIFANAMYVKKGWNPNGEKLGDFASVAVFAGKSFFNCLGITLQARYEWVDQMKINESVLLFGKPSNYFPEGTGYKKVFITPQVSYTKGNISVYLSSDFPIYQYLNTSDFYTQVGSRFQTTVGISYKFIVARSPFKGIKAGTYYCPMHPGQTSAVAGKCPVCGMDMEMKK
ncbi:MAG: heavy metal-binding domain-containing protein [Bacteroidota bacterium]